MDFDFKDSTSTETLEYFRFEERADLIRRLLSLNWNYDRPRNFAQIKILFAVAFDELKSKFRQMQRESQKQKDEAFVELSSHRTYVSNSFGRTGIPSARKKGALDLMTPFEWVWKHTLEVASSISNPDLHWQPSSCNDGEPRKLNITERRWALKLASTSRKLHEEICEEQGSETGVEKALLSCFDRQKLDPSMITIYKNLEDWPRLQQAISINLQCENILDWCKKLRALPWRPRENKLWLDEEGVQDGKSKVLALPETLIRVLY